MAEHVGIGGKKHERKTNYGNWVQEKMLYLIFGLAAGAVAPKMYLPIKLWQECRQK